MSNSAYIFLENYAIELVYKINKPDNLNVLTRKINKQRSKKAVMNIISF